MWSEIRRTGCADMFYRVLQFILLVATTSSVFVSAAQPPVMLFQEKVTVEGARELRTVKSCGILRKPDGSFAFFNRLQPQSGPLELPDADGTMHLVLPYLSPEIADNTSVMSSNILRNTQTIQTGDSEVTSVFVKGEKLDRETAAQVGLSRYLDVWTQRASESGLTEPQMIWRGYNGSQIEYEQMPDGRIIVPFGSMQPHTKPAPPTGRHKTVIQYSDDNGATWNESASRLESPCYKGFNGLNEGACEPAIERLRDGRIWMLTRTQAGFLYESYSQDNGTAWQPANASRFNTSTGPPCIMRHVDGRLVVCWNNCEMPPRANGDGVYGGRDALHIAISDDEGKTWSGFREVYLDHRRNDNPASSGDRGTAYPLTGFTEEGRIAVIAGQGKGGRNVILVDPDWITATTAETDFSDGLKDWSVYSHHGPAKRWWRARAVGCELVMNPEDSAAKSLHVRKQANLPADGATWNFPNGWIGSLTTRMMLRKGCGGASIALTDRMFDPSNDYGEKFAVFRVDIGADRTIGTAALATDQWYDITFRWNLAAGECEVLVNDQHAETITVLNPTLNGVSYVRFRSTAQDVDLAGFLVDQVAVNIQAPHAPAVTVEAQREHEQRYVEAVVPTWQQ